MTRCESKMVDIHNYDGQYQANERRVQNAPMSQHNKDLILGYRDACLLHGVCGKVRLVRVLDVLGRCAVILQKDYDTLTRKDIEHLIVGLQQHNRKPATICTYKAILKRFIGWVCYPDEFPRLSQQPKSVAWMTVHVKRRDEKVLERKDMTTATDVHKLVRAARTARDKALIAALWESGSRIGELGNRVIEDLTKHPHGYLLAAKGKTGHRTVLLVSSAPYLAAWLAQHPFARDPKAPLWVTNERRATPRAMGYATIRFMLQRSFTAAGVTTPFNPHNFRHSRVTDVMSRGIMTDAQARPQFGWTPQSTMVGRYTHLVDTDAHNAVLKENNLLPATPAPTPLTVRTCLRCKAHNPPGTPDCLTCTLPLDERAVYAPTDPAAHQLALQLATILVERGLLDEAAREIHRAKLGDVLTQLAEKEKEDRPTAGASRKAPGSDDTVA